MLIRTRALIWYIVSRVIQFLKKSAIEKLSKIISKLKFGAKKIKKNKKKQKKIYLCIARLSVQLALCRTSILGLP